MLNSFDIEENSPQTLTEKFTNLTILHKIVTDLDSSNHVNQINLILNKKNR